MSSPLFAQERKRVEQVKGEWEISNDITPWQARENAVNQAKVEALRLAGAPERISESNVQFHSESPMRLKDLFESLTTAAISGELAEVTVTREEKKVNDQGNLMYRVWIDATVILHKEPVDPGLGLDVYGVRESYHSPDKLTFEVRPWKEGFLTVFILSEREGTQLFPNKMERQEKLQAGKKYDFPISRGLDYEVTTESAMEINYVLLLFTRDEVPQLKEQTPQNIVAFISALDPSRKCLKTYSMIIRK